MVDGKENEIPKFIRRVLPNATELDRREATANFDEYMAVADLAVAADKWRRHQWLGGAMAAADSGSAGPAVEARLVLGQEFPEFLERQMR